MNTKFKSIYTNSAHDAIKELQKHLKKNRGEITIHLMFTPNDKYFYDPNTFEKIPGGKYFERYGILISTKE